MRAVLLTCVCGLLMLAACAKRQPDRYAQSPQFGTCINGLRQIDGAKQQWALENHQQSTATPGTASLQPYMGRGTAGSTFPTCPAQGSYTVNAINTPPTCSLSGIGHALPQ